MAIFITDSSIQMNKNKRFLITTMLVMGLCITTSSFYGFKPDSRNFEITKNLDIFNSLIKELELYYVDTVEMEKMIRSGVDAMLEQLDPYNSYISEAEQEDFNAMTTGEYGGVGSIIQQRGDSVIISEPYEGMPAQLNDLRPGDVILTIDGESMVGKKTSDVSERLKGQPNTKFTLTIGREGVSEPITKEITRKKIQINAVPYFGMVSDSIGYIYLTSFTDKAAIEVKNALLELKKNPNCKGLILDLRGNPGGILEDAVQVVNLFVPKGKEVLSTRGKVKNWDRTYYTTIDPVDTEIPLIVMVNRGSASASEIVSGALQDLDRAIVIGERTFGKGLVQTTRPLSYNGTVKVTTAKYYIPSGRLIQAIDYAHRNSDGSVGRIPDSLTSEFKTANGRVVRDGGGILPDLQIEQEKSSNLAFYLMRDLLFFDFANQYARKHQKISDIHSFNITDADYVDFKHFVKSKNFTYDKQSDRILKDLKRIAGFEGYLEDANEEFAALEAKLNHNIDRDLDTFREEVQLLLEQEIAKRYYFEKGTIIQVLKSDKEVRKSIHILSNKKEYDTLLAPVIVADKSDKKKNK